MSLCWWLESGVGGRPHVYSSPSRRSADLPTRWVSQTPRRSASRGSTWSRGLREKNSHKAKLGFLIKCIYRVYLFGKWCLGDVLLLHFLTGPHFWVPRCWSRFRSVFTMIKSSTRAKLMDEMCIFGTGGTFDPWSQEPSKPVQQCFTGCFCCILERQENFQPPVESP